MARAGISCLLFRPRASRLARGWAAPSANTALSLLRLPHVHVNAGLSSVSHAWPGLAPTPCRLRGCEGYGARAENEPSVTPRVQLLLLSAGAQQARVTNSYAASLLLGVSLCSQNK